MKSHNLGWVLAGAMALAMAGMVGAGMQSQTMKVGVVDFQKVFNENEHTRKQDESLRAYGKRRQDILAFLDSYKVMDPKSLPKFRELGLKENIAGAEKAELDRIKTDAIAADKKYRDYQTKTPTGDEVKQLEEFNARVRTANGIIARWAQDFDEDLRGMQNRLRAETLVKVRKAVKDVGSKEGYTIVYVNDVAPYAANDLTDAALKAVNAQR